MSHVFISYSRRDLAFAQKIVDELAANNLDTWIDWKSIPKGEDWEQEIYRGIEEADAFLFLISPDSVTSEMCNKEVEHAVKNGKRILPIVLRDTDRKIIHPEISKRNWIFCREGQDDFSKAIEGTQDTIHTDYEWLKYHTKLQVKALDWERYKDHSRLLRGKELREAEGQLAQAGSNTDPNPTTLQHRLILASRTYESRQRRQFIFGATIVILTLTLISLLAKYQSDQAALQRATAQAEATARLQAQQKEEIQRQIALARSLAEQARMLGLPESQNFVGRDAPSGNAKSVATLLAIESIKRNPTFEGNQVLVNLLNRLPLVNVNKSFATDGSITPILNYQNEKSANILISPDQTKMFQISRVTQTNYELHTWMLPDWEEKEITTFVVPEETGLSIESPVVLSTNAEWVSYIGAEGVVLQRISDGFSQSMWETNAPFSTLQFSSDSNFLLVSKQDGTIRVWSVETQTEIAAIHVSPGVENASFLGNGPLLVVETTLIGDRQYDVYIYDTRSGRRIAEFPNSSYLDSDDTGKLVAISFGDRYSPDNIHIWDASSVNEIFEIENECLMGFIHGFEKILTMSIGDNGSCLSGLGNPVHIFDLRKRQREFELSLEDLVWSGNISPEGDIAAISTGQTVHVIDLNETKVLTEIPLDFMADTFDFDPSRSTIAIANRSPLPVVGGVHSFDTVIWDLENNVEVGRIPNDDFIYDLAFMRDGAHIIIIDSEGTLTVWNIKDFWEQKVFEFQHDQPAAMPRSVASGWTFAVPVYNPTGNQLAIGGGNGNLETFDTLSNQQIFSFSMIDNTLSDELTYSPDGKWLAFTGLFCQQGSCPNNVKVLDTGSNSVFSIDHMEPTYIADLAFSPDSRYLAVMWSGTQDVLHIWESSRWELVKKIDLGDQAQRIVSVSFSANGDRLVLTNPGEDGYLRIFNVPDWKKVFELHSSAGPFAFWDEPNLLAASSYDTLNASGVIQLINLDSNKEVSSFQYGQPLRSIAFSSNGSYISAIDDTNTLITWETATGNLVSTKFIPSIGNSLLASPDHPSWFFVSSGDDILIVDIFSGTEIEHIATGENVSSLAISPNGQMIASGGSDGKVQVWYWRPEDFIDEACRRLTRNLSQAEWKQYLGSEAYRPTCPGLPSPTE